MIPYSDSVDNLYLANLSIYYTMMSLQAKIPWRNCDFVGEQTSTDKCRNLNPLVTYTEVCCLKTSEMCDVKFPFPSLVYFANIGKHKTLAPRLINYVIFLIFMLINVRRCIRLLTMLTVTFSIVLIPIIVLTIYYGQNYMMPAEFRVMPAEPGMVKQLQ